jgi:hypothetical protein
MKSKVNFILQAISFWLNLNNRGCQHTVIFVLTTIVNQTKAPAT